LFVNSRLIIFLLSHGYPVVVTDRASLSQVFLSGLDKPEEHIFTRKELTNIVLRKDGVTAEFADGTSHEGSIIIGADGIWSSVRDHLRTIAPEGLFLENPFTASFTGVFGRGPLFDDIPSGQGAEVHGDDWVIQAFPSQKETHLFIYKRIPRTTEKVPFTTNVPQDIVTEFADVKLTPKVTFKDLWDKRYAGGAANFEEGIVELWHWDRVALVGDAAHKVR
jgi:2-polyprenyl-6-methoxyphenol hydroxylase-like FAD-dependent oxidoreductase